MYGRPLDEEVDVYVDPATLLVMRTERWLMAENSMDIRFRARHRLCRLPQRAGIGHPVSGRHDRERAQPKTTVPDDLPGDRCDRQFRSSRFHPRGTPAMKARILYSTLGVFLFSGLGWAQSQDTSPETGEKPLGSYFKTDIDSVSLTNGNLHLSIPVFSLPGREVPISFSLRPETSSR
jgi:hypothetical protein